MDEYPVGTKVKVHSADMKENLGEGEIVAQETHLGVSDVPRIKLDSGEIIMGFQCWWEPIEEDKE